MSRVSLVLKFGRAMIASMLVVAPHVSFAVEANEADASFFALRVEPLLKKRCFECHSHAAGKIKGGLTLDSKMGWSAGGDSGPAIVPGAPEKSLFVKAIRRDGLEMPPDNKLPDSEIQTFVEWIQRGAFDPREKAITAGEQNWAAIFAQRKSWWCWQPVRRPAVPVSPHDARADNAVDRFLFSTMSDHGLTPSRDADPLTLVRRLSYVLTGLPPSRNEVDAVLAATSQSDTAWNYEAVVDRLLASPRFGEHWARHWLDLVRYSDSHGSEHDPLIPHAWRYRDYVVRAFNEDLPYRRFVQEHLAGDLLPSRWNRVLGINESLLGTTFHRFVEFYPTPVDPKTEEIDVIDSQIDATMKTFQALTVTCARCHDHKFDAISARDYYALYGVFASTRTTMHRLDDPAAIHARDAELLAWKQSLRGSLAEQWSRDVEQFGVQLDAAAAIVEQQMVPKKIDEAKTAAERLAFALQEAKRPEQLLFPFQKLLTAKAATKSPPPPTLAALAGGANALGRALDPQQFRVYANFGPATEPPALVNETAWFASDSQLAANSRPGDFVVATAGSRIVSGIYPRGRFSHLLSDKQGGTLRSPNFPLDMKFVSVLVCGTNKARARLVVENFQGDELLFARANPKLNHEDLQWVTMPIKPQWSGRRAYLEFVPRDDMTYVGKIADAATLPADGRSGVGVRQIVFHDQPAPPSLASVLPDNFWEAAANWSAATERLAWVAKSAIAAWRDNRATDDDAWLLGALLRQGLLTNEAAGNQPLAKQVAAYREIEATIPVPRRVPGVADEEGFDERFFPRGNYRQAGAPVTRRNLEILSSTVFSARGSGRGEFAASLVGSDNPLTSRVMVNRIWQHVFGTGLVRTPDNFGQLGETPSHSALLDWLASEFVAGDWSVKQFVRLLVTSRAFRLSAEASEVARERDPENRWLSHASIRRLAAEAIRDSLLEVSGRANYALGGLQIPLPFPKTYKDFDPHVSGPLDGAGRRSLYLEARRNYPAPFLQAFDQPRPIVTIGRRNVTNVPAQSLALLNDPFVRQQAELLGQRAFAAAATDEQRVAWLYQESLRRPPSAAELQRALQFLQTQPPATNATAASAPPAKSDERWLDLAHALLNSKEFIYLR